jgi:hypothetical protein
LQVGLTPHPSSFVRNDSDLDNWIVDEFQFVEKKDCKIEKEILNLEMKNSPNAILQEKFADMDEDEDFEIIGCKDLQCE